MRAAFDGQIIADLTDRVVQRRGEEAWVRTNPGPAYVGERAPPPEISRLPLRKVNEPVLWVPLGGVRFTVTLPLA